MAKVSVIVPVYNTEKYLKRCMDALVHQTLEDIEIIAVNDGSTDSSIEILKKYESEFPTKVRVITKKNGGQATARNLGIREATGEFIGFADSDDYVDTTMFEKMYQLAKERNADYVECHFYFLQESADGSVKKLPARGRVREYSSQKDMFLDPQVSPWNKLYKREILLEEGREFPEGLIYEDTAFYIKSIVGIKKSAYLDEHLVYYFLRENSTMNANKSKRVANIFEVLQDICNYYEAKGLYKAFENEIEYFSAKILLCSNMSRIGRVEDKALRKELIDKTFTMLHAKFPKYKKNPYFKGKIGIYIKCMNKVWAYPVSRVLGCVMKG